MSPECIIKQLSADIRYLRKSAKKTKLSTNYKMVRQILRENLHFFEREGIRIRKQLKCNQKAFGETGEMIVTLCEDVVIHMHRSVIQSLFQQLRQTSRWYTVADLNGIPNLLSVYLIHLATMGVKSENADMLNSAVSGMHQLKDLNIEELFCEFSYTESVFRRDPAGIYATMEQSTKAYYRELCAKEAANRNITEQEYADYVLQNAHQKHIGFVLVNHSSDHVKRRILGKRMLMTQVTVSAFSALAFSVFCQAIWLWFFTFPLFYQLLRQPIARIFQKQFPPHFMPRLEMHQTIPESSRILVTVSALLPKPDQATAMADHLEQLFLANQNGAVDFCLLADFCEHKSKHHEQDEAMIEAMKHEIKRLNQQYNNRFLLVVRPRVYSKTQDSYSGWERKRGAILQLTEAILTHRTDHFHTLIGPIHHLFKTKYLFALDQDSILPFNAAYEMVTAAAHPLNQPVLNAERTKIVGGYGILSPQIANQADSTTRTLFATIHSPRGGLSAYHAFCSNANQDLLGQIPFCGKGLIHVSSYYSCLKASIPSEQLLSHDIIEGGFLRCGLVSDVEIADTNPDNAIAWDKRQHRWIRGDFQNISWLMPTIEHSPNPLSTVSRVMVGENLLRAATPISALLLLIFAAFSPALACTLPLLVGMVYCIEGLFGMLFGFFRHGLAAINQQYYSRLLPMAVISLVQGIFSLISLVTTATITANGAIKGLYRQLISHKHCMEWSTADQVSFERKNGLLSYLYHNRFSVIFGLLFLFAPFGLTRLFGILFLTAPIVQWQTAKPLDQNDSLHLSNDDVDFLTQEGKKIWQYYVDFCTAEHHYLPPDNMQEAPVYAVAPRTSPTNIGLMLLSTVCAEDLGYIDEQEMVERIEKTYSTVEKLERYQGHLLNWYDTKTTKPLFPRYCSTVDSGNFACMLSTVKNRLKSVRSHQSAQLIARMERDLSNMDFSIFYNAHRQLLHIGYDLETNQLSSSYYDMLMSEARMTSYYAVANRQVPPRHWRALSRTLTKSGRHVGPLSWTGTAFEYLMPPLLLPTVDNTLCYEAMNFCIGCQKKIAGSSRPWGCSESGYYAFDDDLNYQYKPNGVAQLALKCLNQQEYVVAPYASFLALPFAGRSAIKNLRKIQQLGASGQYGFYEAIDYTARRCKHKQCEIIKSYMAHHVGMSLCAIENVLKNNRLQALFMQNETAGAKTLLAETIPGGASVYRPLIERNTPEKPRFMPRTTKTSRLVTAEHSSYGLFFGSQRQCLVSDGGKTMSLWKGLQLYATSDDFLEAKNGILFHLQVNHASHWLTLAPHYQNQNNYSFSVQKNKIVHTYKTDAFSCNLQLSLSADLTAEIRTATFQNHSSQPLNCRLTVYFEPILHTKEQYRSHPAFHKLFIKSQWDAQAKRMQFVKQTRASEQPACLMAGLIHAQHVDVHCNTRTAIDHQTNSFQFNSNEQSHLQSVPDPCCCMSIPFVLQPKSNSNTTFILSVGDTIQQAAASFDAALSAPMAETVSFNHSSDGHLAKELLPHLLTPLHNHTRKYRAGTYSRNNLWSVGLSGDFPLVVTTVRDSRDLERLKPWLDGWYWLTQHGICSDFVILYKELGDYSRQLSGDIQTVITNCGLADKTDKNGGIHCINTAIRPKAVRTAILCSAAYVITRTLHKKTNDPVFRPIALHTVSPDLPNWQERTNLDGGYFSHDRFVITQTPKVPWSHLLANPDFGTQLTNKSLGFTYAYNARENRLTPWSNDPITHHMGERLILRIGQNYYDLIDGSTPIFSPEQAEYRGKIQQISYRVTVTVRQMQKQIRVEFERAPSSDSQIALYTLPTLDFDRKYAHQLLGDFSESIPAVYQPFNTTFNGWMAMGCSNPIQYCTDMLSFWSGQWDTSPTLPTDHCCLAGIATTEQAVTFTIAYGKTANEAKSNAIPLTKTDHFPQNKWKIQSTQPALDVMVNYFLPHQTITSRLFARTGFYQCSGAYGFRDQLQDAGNIIPRCPHLARQQILRCCSRQFEEGDVLHWWHELPAGPAGVRTRCSDDMLWLPYYTARYVNVTDEQDFLRSPVAYLSAPCLQENEQEKYLHHFDAGKTESVYEHCKRALSRVQFSKRGLANIGSCDWNDGFSAVGTAGQGESVWLTQFYALVCETFAPIAHMMHDHHYAEQLKENALACKRAVEQHCWDNDHYTRAYFDDGRVIGATHCKENQLDVLPQAFAVLAKLPHQQRNVTAVLTAYEKLVDHKNRLIRLFTPPFEEVDAGYISNYPAGIRENGGQYTHGVIWLIQALLQIGETDKAFRLIEYVNPSTHSPDQNTAQRYQGEPYAMAGDVYTHPQAVGKSGWTHYTGAAGWLYRIIWEDLFGIQIKNGRLIVDPHLPKSLYDTRCCITFENTEIELILRLTHPLKHPKSFLLDGQKQRHIIEDDFE